MNESINNLYATSTKKQQQITKNKRLMILKIRLLLDETNKQIIQKTNTII